MENLHPTGSRQTRHVADGAVQTGLTVAEPVFWFVCGLLQPFVIDGHRSLTHAILMRGVSATGENQPQEHPEDMQAYDISRRIQKIDRMT